MENEIIEREADSYDLIRYLRDAQDKFFEKYSLDGCYWRVNIEVLEMGADLETPLKRILDEGRR